MRKVSKRVEKVCDFAERHGEVTSTLLVEHLGMSYDQARQYLKRATSYGMLVCFAGTGTQLKRYRVSKNWRSRIQIDRQSILGVLLNRDVTAAKLAAEVGVSQRSVSHLLTRLRQEGVIDIVGAEKRSGSGFTPLWGKKRMRRTAKQKPQASNVWAGLL